MIKKIIYASICCILSLPSLSYASGKPPVKEDDKPPAPVIKQGPNGQQGNGNKNKGGGNCTHQ